MRKYNTMGQLEKVVCNQCKKEVICSGDILKEQFFSVRYSWGYFSGRDGETDEWDLCQDCYEKLVKSFQIACEVSEKTELMDESAI